MSERIKVIGKAIINSTSSIADQFKNYFIPLNPAVKVPDYEMIINQPSKKITSIQNGKEIETDIKTILKQMQEQNIEFKIKNVSELISQSTPVKKSLRTVFFGEDGSKIIDELNIEVKIENSRTQLNKFANLKIFNPSMKRIEYLIPGNLIEIRMGYSATTLPTVFFGYITDVSQSWEGGDFALQLVAVPYVDGIISATEYTYSGNTIEIMKNASVEPQNIDGVWMTSSPTEAFQIILDYVNEITVNKFGIKLEFNREEFESMNDVRKIIKLLENENENSIGLKFIPPSSRRKRSIKEVINLFMYQILLSNNNDKWIITWWMDSNIIRFPAGQSNFYIENGVDGSLVPTGLKMGDNVYKINGKLNVDVNPSFSTEVVNDNTDPSSLNVGDQSVPTIQEDFNDNKLFDIKLSSIRYIVIMAIGIPNIVLGTLLRVSSNTVSEIIDTQLDSIKEGGQISNNQSVANVMPDGTDISKEIWVVDAFEHIFNSTESYRTRIRAIPAIVAMKKNWRPVTPQEKYKFQLNDQMLNFIDMFRQGFQGFSIPMTDEYIKHLKKLNEYVDEKDDDGKILGTNDDFNVTDLINSTKSFLVLNTTENSKKVIINHETLGLNNRNDVEANRYFVSSAYNTSTWAMMYKSATGSQWLSAGIHYPKYRAFKKQRKFTDNTKIKNHYSQVNQRHLLHRIDNEVYGGLQDWNVQDGRPPGCYHTDYMFRTPARSTILIPTSSLYKDVKSQSTKNARGSSDGGTKTEIFTSILNESNPLEFRNNKQHTAYSYRPNIKNLIERISSYTKSIVDNTTKPFHASSVRHLIHMSDEERVRGTSLIMYYRDIQEDSNVGYNYRSPAIELILDNDKNKIKKNMTRFYMRKGDEADASKVDIVEVGTDNRYDNGSDPSDLIAGSSVIKNKLLTNFRQKYKTSHEQYILQEIQSGTTNTNGPTDKASINIYNKNDTVIQNILMDSVNKVIRLDAKLTGTAQVPTSTEQFISLDEQNNKINIQLDADTTVVLGPTKNIKLTGGLGIITINDSTITIENGSVTWTMSGGAINIT